MKCMRGLKTYKIKGAFKLKAEIIIRDRMEIILRSILEIDNENAETDKVIIKYKNNKGLSEESKTRRINECKKVKEFNQTRKIGLIAQADVLKWALGDYD